MGAAVTSPAITDVAGITVGHWTDERAATGCTVILGPRDGMVAAAYTRGRATGTRELDALDPKHLVPRIHALLLTGGSAYGLGAADGVMRWLAERGRGFPIAGTVVPIVPTAVIFDLALGSATWPTAEQGYAACAVASSEVAQGSCGVGTGATVGKVLGLEGAMKGGVGTWAERRGDLVVGALVAVNAFGDVRDAQGAILAGARREGRFVDACAVLAAGNAPPRSAAGPGTHTTLGVVACNAALTQLELAQLAVMAWDGLAQRITPAGTAFDGDIVFALSTGALPAGSTLAVEVMAQRAIAQATERAVRLARGLAGIAGLADPPGGTR